MPEALFQISEPGESRPKAACLVRVAGIDLGTTHSLVAIVEGGQPRCLVGQEGEEDGEALLPSAVHYSGSGDVVVGARARGELAGLHPRDTIVSVKRFMGRGSRDAEGTLLSPYDLAFDESGRVVRFRVAGGTRVVTPVEVSAEILKTLKARAEAAMGAPLEGVVITVPAYFDDAQRQATRDAGRLAGLEVMRLLNEPTAAALAYGLDRQAEGTFAVFDLGGGTFDVSILGLEAGVFEVKATGGDSALGGDDFDRAIAARFFAIMGEGVTTDGGHDARTIRRVLDAARAAKEALTTASSVAVNLERADGARIEYQLSRAEMETLTRPVLERCAGPVRRAIKDAGLAPGALAGVVLVGGATRMPMVRAFVGELFGRQPLFDIDPDQVVALGAAVQAQLLGGGAGAADVVLLDVVPLSLGLEMMGGVVEKIIHRNTTVPCGAKQTFTTYADKQTGFDLHVVQGEREMAEECRSLARFKLTGIPPVAAGMARLEVTFTVDADGLLAVSARELLTGNEATVSVKPSYGMTEDEVERMLLDSFAHADEDVKRRLLTEQQVEAQGILAATRAAMAASPDLLTDEDQAAIAAAITALEAAAVASDHRAIHAAVTGLDKASKDFAERRMNRALAEGIAGRDLGRVERDVNEHALQGRR
jgi:molecular chaperone HscA